MDLTALREPASLSWACCRRGRSAVAAQRPGLCSWRSSRDALTLPRDGAAQFGMLAAVQLGVVAEVREGH